MKSNQLQPGLKGRPFNGKPHLKLKRIRTEPRQRIRQLQRSFLPLSPQQNRTEPHES